MQVILVTRPTSYYSMVICSYPPTYFFESASSRYLYQNKLYVGGSSMSLSNYLCKDVHLLSFICNFLFCD